MANQLEEISMKQIDQSDVKFFWGQGCLWKGPGWEFIILEPVRDKAAISVKELTQSITSFFQIVSFIQKSILGMR